MAAVTVVVTVNLHVAHDYCVVGEDQVLRLRLPCILRKMLQRCWSWGSESDTSGSLPRSEQRCPHTGATLITVEPALLTQDGDSCCQCCAVAS